MAQGRFRDDLYYRLCSDVIATPSLRAQLNDQPDDIEALVFTLVARQLGCDVPEVVERVIEYIRKHLVDYSWPGNVRELEQCVRSILVRGRYVPISSPGATPRERLARKLERETPTSDELLNEYCRVIYGERGNYSEVSRMLGLDRRTVQRRIDA
jgi:transcriptional regulator with PAS, ATPase and Fis domain